MKKFTFIFLFFLPFILKADHWTQKANFGGTPRFGSAYFAIGNKGYIGPGCDQYPGYHFANDMWEYDQATNTWTQKANFPGTPRFIYLAFALGSKAYVGTGWNGASTDYGDLWEYDQTTNGWTQKGNFPGLPRNGAFTTVLNNKAYAGMGLNGSSFLNDFYSYNDTNDTWTQLASFPGAARVLPFSFGINGRIYVGAGSGPAFSVMNDFWEYNPGNNTWTQKTNFPGAARFGPAYFSINGKGYAGVGKNASITFYDFYVYDPVFNSWSQRASFPDSSIEIEVGFTLGSFGYSGCGTNSSMISTNHFWEYTPDSITSVIELNSDDSFKTFPNPATIQVTVNFKKATDRDVQLLNSRGELLEQTEVSFSSLSIDMSTKPNGIYFITVTNQVGNKVTKKIVKM